MKKTSRFLIGAGCFILLCISWLIAIKSSSTAEKQLELMRKASGYVEDGIFVSAVPLLEEAAGYNAANTLKAEEELKKVYLALMENGGFKRKYTALLDKQMNRKDAKSGVFAEAAHYYLSISKYPDALKALKTGIEKTGSEDLNIIYESNRYRFEMSRSSYDYVAAIYGSSVQVERDGLWGIARSDGVPVIPCEYDKISTYSAGRAVVMKSGEIYAVDKDNNRVAKLHEHALDFGNLADDRIPLRFDDGWRRAFGSLDCGTIVFEKVGMYSSGYAAAKSNGKWGVIDSASGWLIPAEYDGIIQDELGRCYAQGAVFTQKDGEVFLIVQGRQIDGAFEDARPFSGEGYAAVRKNGKWGYIDTNGEVKVGFIYDDALSFGQHLAAVKIGELWGYISIYGENVIAPAFLEAKSFSNGSAPVLTGKGWQFITLLEYKKEAGL